MNKKVMIGIILAVVLTAAIAFAAGIFSSNQEPIVKVENPKVEEAPVSAPVNTPAEVQVKESPKPAQKTGSTPIPKEQKPAPKYHWQWKHECGYISPFSTIHPPVCPQCHKQNDNWIKFAQAEIVFE
jgi:hypothetical protein